jgi:hypothetical protein
MKVNLDKEILDLLMPDCRDEDIKPHAKVKQILMEYYSTKKVKNDERFEQVKNRE